MDKEIEKRIRRDEREKIAGKLRHRSFTEPRTTRGLWAEIAALVDEERL